ncbi:MAG: hypothetical protein CMD72_04675, partial [Gammaproteobacteria bacterium]|nr:hypothetical protein [Gammaproteobacteria bacterium]
LSSGQGTTNVEATFTLGADGDFGAVGDATDKIYLNMDDTTDGTATGIQAVGATVSAYTGADGGAYDWSGLDTAAVDVVVLPVASTPNTDDGTLFEDYGTGKAANLFTAMAAAGAATDNVGSITVDTAGDKFFIFAYDDATDSGDQGMYIYHANSAAVVSDTSITENEVTFVAFIDGVADDTVEPADTDGIVMFDLTTIDSTY